MRKSLYLTWESSVSYLSQYCILPEDSCCHHLQATLNFVTAIHPYLYLVELSAGLKKRVVRPMGLKRWVVRPMH